jgi:hypothetical protein
VVSPNRTDINFPIAYSATARGNRITSFLGEVVMTNYSLRFIDLNEVVTQIYQCEYKNALDALDAAKGLSSAGTVEVWSANARIARIKKDNQPSGPDDRVSG